MEKRETIFLNGKEYRMEESIPVISGLLNSSVESEQLAGLKSVWDWAWQLQGSDLIVRTIALFNDSNSHDVQVAALTALCAVEDVRAEGAFEKASTSTDEFFNVVGLVGLANIRGPAGIPPLVEAMINTDSPILIRCARVAIIGLAGSEFYWPPKDVRKSGAVKKKYLQEFAQWWQANKDRLDAEWKVQLGGKNRAKESFPQPRIFSMTKLPVKNKTARADEQKPSELLLRDAARGQTPWLKLIAFAAGGLLCVGAVLWLILKKKP